MKLPVTPSFRLDGKRAVVTGAGRGIGLAAASALAAAGASVTLVSRTEAEISAIADAINVGGGSACAVTLDVIKTKEVRSFFDEQPAFDVVVNNAGTNRPMSVVEVTEDDYDAVLNLNLRSAFFVAQSASRRMIETKVAGSLIHMSSQMGHVGGANRSLYCASKFGLEGLNKALALDLAAYGIRSNTVAPTFIETAMTQSFFSDEVFRDRVLTKIKLGRLGRVEDLMGAVVFLASSASALVTGTSLVVDGGWTVD